MKQLRKLPPKERLLIENRIKKMQQEAIDLGKNADEAQALADILSDKELRLTKRIERLQDRIVEDDLARQEEKQKKGPDA
jgi:hypothetical protein